MPDARDLLSPLLGAKKSGTGQEHLLRELCSSIREKDIDVYPEWGDEDHLVLRGSKTSDVNKTARIMTLSCKNKYLKLRVLNEVTKEGEYQMKFRKFSENHLENILDMIFENFDDDDRLDLILAKTFKARNHDSFEDKLHLLSRINDNLCHVLRSTGKFEVSKEDLLRKVQKSIYEQNLDITTDWNMDTDIVILRGSKRLDGAPLLSSRNRAWMLNVSEETTNAGEYQMKFERRPDLMTDIEHLLSPLLGVKKLETFQDFLLRKLCEIICERKINVYPEWGVGDTLILRGSKTSDLTKIIQIRGLSCKFVYWKLAVLEDTTEDGEYQMKFTNLVDGSESTIIERLKKVDEGEMLMSSISLPGQLESFQRSLVREVCGSICDNEWDIIPKWNHTENALVLKRSKELDATKVPIGELACDNSYWKFNLLDETTQDGDYQMKFEKTARYDKLMQHCCHRDFPMPRLSFISLPFRPLGAKFSTGITSLRPISETVSVSQDTTETGENEMESKSLPEIDNQETPKNIPDLTPDIKTLLSRIIGVKGFGATQKSLLREVCTSISEKRLNISPEWRLGGKGRLILKGSKTSDAAKISQIKCLTCENFAWRLKVSEDVTEADEYQMIFEPIPISEDCSESSAVPVSQGSLTCTLLDGEKSDVDQSMSSRRRHQYHTQLRAELVPEWMNDQLHRTRPFECSQGELLKDLCQAIHDQNLNITPECHDIDAFILRGSEQLDITELSRILDLPRENKFWKLDVLENTTEAGEHQVKFERNFEETIKDENEGISEVVPDMSKVNDLLSHIQPRKPLPTALLDACRALCVSICAKEVPITPEWDETTETLILRGSENLHIIPSVKGEFYSLDVFASSVTEAGEYRMRLKQNPSLYDPLRLLPVRSTARGPRTTCSWTENGETLTNADVMSDANSLLSGIQSANDFIPAQVDILRSLCISICKRKVGFVPHWDPTTDTLILRGSASVDSLPLSYLGSGWSLFALPGYAAEAGEYRMRMKFVQEV